MCFDLVWWLLVHGDGDGIVSGALAYKALPGEKKIFFTHPAGLLDDLAGVKEGENVFIADIALSIGLWEKILDKLKVLNRKGSKIIYIDHHPLPEEFDIEKFPGEFIHSIYCSASELVYKYFVEKRLFSEKEYEMERLAIFGAVSDYLDETVWVKEKILNWDKRMVYFEAGLLAQGLESSRKMYDFKRRILKHLSTGELPSTLSDLVVRALMMTGQEEDMRRYVVEKIVVKKCIAYVVNPPGSVPRAANYTRVYGEKPVGIAIEVRGNTAIMSIRTNNPAIDLYKILAAIVSKYNGVGGGHKVAAGARVPLELLQSFLSELDTIICNKISQKPTGLRS